MTRSRAIRLPLVILVLAFLATAAQAQLGAVVSNWTVPSSSFSSGSSSSSSSGLHHTQMLGDVTLPVFFVGQTPCRIVDTRGPAGPYGAPSLPASTPRNFALRTGPCAGISSGAVAYSLNITVTNTLGPGFISLYPQGGVAPLVSTLNYIANQTLANAAIVPAGTGGGVTAVAGVSGTDLIIDINGYYVANPLNNNEPVTVVGSYGGGVLYGFNANNAGYGVWGDSTGGIGVYGTSVNYNGVWGQSTNWDAIAAFGGRDGIYGQGARNGIVGASAAASGATFGVIGSNGSTSNCSAGVFGQDGAAIPCLWGGTGGPGVYGTAATTWAILGLSSGSGGFGRGVQGSRVDAAGNFQTSGVLGYLGTIGVFSFNDIVTSGAKDFAEPHPTDASKQIVYTAMEGPESGTYFRGRGRFVSGQAVIPVPEDFRLVTEAEGLTAQITPIGQMAQVGVVSMDLNSIAAESSRDVAFSYLIQGVRKGYANAKPIRENEIFVPAGPDDRMGPYPERIRQRLVSLGIYRADGTVNMETAERFGWAQQWRDQAAASAAAERAGKKP